MGGIPVLRNPGGVEILIRRFPRVSPQTGLPWALYHNPFGVEIIAAFAQGRPADGPTLGFVSQPPWGWKLSPRVIPGYPRRKGQSRSRGTLFRNSVGVGWSLAILRFSTPKGLRIKAQGRPACGSTLGKERRFQPERGCATTRMPHEARNTERNAVV